MPLDHHFVCPLTNGVHARPASALEALARRFVSELTLVNRRTGQVANCKSILSIISADIRQNDACLLTVSGLDEPAAMAAMVAFVKDTFPHCDDNLPACSKPDGKPHLPPGLRNTNVKFYSGKPVVSGIAKGRLMQVGSFKIPATLRVDDAVDLNVESRALDEALQKLTVFYDQRLAAGESKIEIQVFEAHRSIARDPEFHGRLHAAIDRHKRTVAGAIADAEAHFSAMLADSGSELLRERALDIQDVCRQLLRQVHGDAIGATEIQLLADTIIVAESLTPSQFLALDRHFLKGLVLGHAGSTSHTVILARAFDIPTLTGVNLAGVNYDNQDAVLDADAGVLVTELNDAARRYYAMEYQRLASRQLRVQQFASQPAMTMDGHHIEVAANIASADEAAAAIAAGAEGIGLFRTEMLFLDRESAPEENEQFEIYCRTLAAAGGRPVIIRTLDVGGDKPLEYLKLPAEENPFLGYRAVRIYAEFEPLFRTQIRALIRASAQGNLKIMIPMIATVDEARRVKTIVAEEQSNCAGNQIPFDQAMHVGAMIEVPSAALAVDALGCEVDFFSIGSNDLLQYFMAVDRSNPRVAELYNPLQPAFLRLLKQIVDAAHAQKKWTGLCGEMGGQPQFLPLLIGLGLDEISVASPVIANLKSEFATLNSSDCQQLLNSALNCATANEVAVLLEEFASQHRVPLLDADLIIADADAVTREEAIKQAVSQLYVLGRTKNPQAVEATIWQREQVYSTGFGHGFAIPHCKTNAVQSNSLVLVKLRTPVAWPSLDSQPVSVMILLAMRETNSTTEHMKVFAKLARQVMNEEFRARLQSESDPKKLCAFLREKLDVGQKS